MSNSENSTPAPISHVMGSIPAGWKLVPIKPTEDMLDAALGVHESRDGEDEEFFAEFRRTYSAMVKAAPPAIACLVAGENGLDLTALDAALDAADDEYRAEGDDNLAFKKALLVAIRTYLANLPPPVPLLVGTWLPIERADKTITDVQSFPEVGMTISMSDRYWVRDEDGRVYEAAWSEGNHGDRDYWWDFEGESPVDPVEFMPHPLDPRFAVAEVSDDA